MHLNKNLRVSFKWWVLPPISHPKCWSFLVGKNPMGFVGVSPTILGNTPHVSGHGTEPMDRRRRKFCRGCFEQHFTDGCRSLAGWGEGHNSSMLENRLTCNFCTVSLSLSLCIYMVVSKTQGFRWFLRAVFLDMGVSKNRGTPKWMVYNGKPH